MDQSTYYNFASASAVVAAAAFAYSVLKNKIDSHRDQNIRARDAWAGYMKLAFDNPELSLGSILESDKDKYEKYEWFVSMMLFAAEEVLYLSTDDRYWNSVIATQIEYHLEYLKRRGEGFLVHYSPELQVILRQELGFHAKA